MGGHSQYLQEAGNLQLDPDALLQLLLLLELVLKGAGQHVGEQLQRHRQQQLHEGDGQNDGHGHHAKHVRCCPCQLLALPPVERSGHSLIALTGIARHPFELCRYSTSSVQAQKPMSGNCYDCDASKRIDRESERLTWSESAHAVSF